MSSTGPCQRTNVALTFATLIILSACASDNPVAPSSTYAPALGQSLQDVQGLYVVDVKGATTQGITAALTQMGATVRTVVPQIGVVTVSGLDASKAATLARRADVAGVYRDMLTRIIVPRRKGPPLKGKSSARVSGIDQSSALFFPFQWNLPKTSVPQAWQITAGGGGKTVWVLDTGYDPNQQDLAGHVPCYSTGISVPRFASDATPYDFNFHGSFVASLVSSNGIGNASVAPGARVCSRKVLSEDGVGTFGDVASAIVYAADMGANVINMSLGAYFDSRSEGGVKLVNMMQRAVDFAANRGVVVVAAAGNQAVNLDKDLFSMISLPAQLQRVLSAGATGPNLSGNYDALATYSNYGGETGVDMMAPGGDLPNPANAFDLILGACSSFVCGGPDFYILAGGTSFSAPHVAAAAAIVQSVLGGAPAPDRVTKCLTSMSDPIGAFRIFGPGRLNVLKAISCQ